MIPGPASHVTPKPPHSLIKNFFSLKNWVDGLAQTSSLSGELLGGVGLVFVSFPWFLVIWN